MRNFSSTSFIWLLAALGLASCSDDRTPDRSADEREIRLLVAENAAASNAGNPAGVAATYTSDGDAWISGQSRVSTHQRIAEMEGEWITMPGYQRWEGEVEEVRFISRDAAIVEVSATTFLDTGKFDEETTLVVARTDGAWKIAAWRVMNIDQALLNLLAPESVDADEQRVEEAARAEMDPAKLAPHIYQVELENDRARVLRVTVRPAETPPRHSHPDRAVVYVNECVGLVPDQDGAMTPVKFVAGDAIWATAETHGGRPNAVDNECEVLEVELK